MRTIAALSSLDWFGNVGQGLTPEMLNLGFVGGVLDWAQATSLSRDPSWDDYRADARNAVTMHLNSVCKKEFQRWNEVIADTKSELSSSWARLSSFVEQHSLDGIVVSCARWDTLNAVATERYLAWNPPGFYPKLLKGYLAGHFPCGWRGSWPSGQVIVF